VNIDYLIFQKINNLAGRYLVVDNLAKFLATYFGYILIFILILYLLKSYKRYWKLIIEIILAGVLSRLVLTEIIRFFYKRPRPFVENNVNLLLNHSPSTSFPSGHAAFYFAIATVVFLYYKKVHPRPKFWWGAGLLFFFASFLISLSRVFVGIHWPSDILGGAVVGIISGIIVLKLFSKK
jgi:undecaprenyl-diphosphatase